MSKLASLLIKISANGAAAEKELRTLEKSLDEFAKKMKSIGNTLSTTVTAPLVALAGVAVAATNKQQQAEARLLTALKGREEVQQRLIASAAELQARSTLGDEVIIEQQAYLAALGLSEQQINSTIEAAAQLSAALGMDLNSAVRNLAKTYSGLAGELGESIPALRELTAEVMKAGGAIAYVNGNYRGFAEIAAKTGAGSLAQLKNQLGDVAEKIGVALMPALNSIVDMLKQFATWLQSLSPETIKWGVAIAGVAAAIGPLIRVGSTLIGNMGHMVKLLPTIISGLKLIVNPAGLAAIALGTVATAIWSIKTGADAAKIALDNMRREGAKTRAEEMYERQYKLYNRPGVSDEEIAGALNEMRSQLNADANLYITSSGGRMTEKQVDELAVLQAGIRALEEIQLLRKKEKEDLQAINDELSEGNGLIPKLKQKVEELNKELSLATTEDEIRRINGELAKTSAELTRLQGLKPFQGLAEVIDTSNADLSGLTGVSLDNPLLKPGQDTTNPVRELNKKMEGWLKDAQETDAIAQKISSGISETIIGIGKTIGESLGKMFSGEIENPLQGILTVLADALKSLGAALLTYEATVIAAKAALSNPLTAGAGIAIGIAAIAAGTVLQKLAAKPVALAKGGLAYGPTLAVVGDNKGASYDPEVVAPLSKLRQYMGGQKLELVGGVEFVLRGDTARAVLNRENVRILRLG